MAKETITISKTGLKRFVIFLMLLGLVAFTAFLGWKYVQQRRETERAQQTAERLSNPEESAKDAEDKLIERVKKVVVVPDDERPTIANVTDANQLKDQPLFALIENGDKVLLYVKARRQIIYRPSTGQVITAVTLPEDNTVQDASNIPQDATVPAEE